jgi:hypothetical protein
MRLSSLRGVDGRRSWGLNVKPELPVKSVFTQPLPRAAMTKVWRNWNSVVSPHEHVIGEMQRTASLQNRLPKNCVKWVRRLSGWASHTDGWMKR